jgi:hypothetical protein
MTNKKIPLNSPLGKGEEEMDCRADQESARNGTEDKSVSLMSLFVFIFIDNVHLSL